jgi:hypothetical protein
LFSIKQGQSDEVRDLCVVEHSNQVFVHKSNMSEEANSKILNDNQEKTMLEKLLMDQKFSTVKDEVCFCTFIFLSSSIITTT